MKSRIALVTGGAGFIGSHLVDRLLQEGWRVRVVDNYSTGRPENLAHHKKSAKLDLIRSDISQPDASFVKAFKGVNWVFHLAALADIVPSIVQPMEYHRSNVDGTVNVLEASRMAGIQRFIYAASSSCYGIPDMYPTPEMAPARPQYPYALTKYIGEQYVLHWGQIYKLPVVSTRFFNVYGPKSRTSGTYGAVFGIFLAQKLAGVPYTVVGDGTQTRDFTFVSDIVDALFTVASNAITNEVFNVGSGNTYSVNRLVELLGGEVTYIPKRPGEPDCTQADVTKIKKMLKWKAKVSLEEGVKILIENIDYWKRAPIWTPKTIEQATKEWFAYLGK
jgi:UDP-glucose 4-epimerase